MCIVSSSLQLSVTTFRHSIIDNSQQKSSTADQYSETKFFKALAIIDHTVSSNVHEQQEKELSERSPFFIRVKTKAADFFVFTRAFRRQVEISVPCKTISSCSPTATNSQGCAPVIGGLPGPPAHLHPPIPNPIVAQTICSRVLYVAAC